MTSTLRIISFAAIFSLLLFSSCSKPLQTVGKTVLPQEKIEIIDSNGAEHIWQTSDLVLKYTIEDGIDTITVSGTVVISDRVLYTYPIARFLNIYISLLDKDGVAASRHLINLRVSAYNTVSEKIPFRTQVAKGEDITSFAFSYWGTFRESGASVRRHAEELEIFHNSFAN